MLSTLMIFVCHFLQGLSNDWAYIFNIGVQLFFLISGFLYGKKGVVKVDGFIKSRFGKVYLPYIVFFAIVVIAYQVFDVCRISPKTIVFYLLNLQGFSALLPTPIEGLNHLWFLTILMICYGITPFVHCFLKKHKVLFFMSLVLLIIVECVFLRKLYSVFICVLVYLTGLLYGKYEEKVPRWIFLLPVPFLIMILLQGKSLEGLMANTYGYIWFKFLLSVFGFCFLYFLLSAMKITGNKVIAIADNYSYEFYLIHHVFILGPFSLMTVARNISLSLLIIVLVTSCLAYVLKKLTVPIAKKIL